MPDIAVPASQKVAVFKVYREWYDEEKLPVKGSSVAEDTLVREGMTELFSLGSVQQATLNALFISP